MSNTLRAQTAFVLGSVAAAALLTSGCSSIGDTLSGGKVDYRSSGSQTVKLDVPPDLTQLPGQSRFGQVPASGVSANEIAQEAARRNASAPGSTAIAPSEASGVRLMRDGQTRWLLVSMPAEQVWPKVRAFWEELGFTLTTEQADAGVMETNFAENRANVTQDGVRKALGRVFDMLYDSGERDQYRTRIERTANGTEIYIAHRGLVEEYVDPQRKEQTTWRPRPSDPQLEAAMLSRLMAKLGATEQQVQDVSASADTTAAQRPQRAQLQDDKTSLRMSADFDTAWRRVGLALDRSGYTIESRDHRQGTYLVRVARQQTEEPGFFAKLFGRDQSANDVLSRYQIKVGAQGQQALIQVLDDKGAATSSPAAQKVAQQLLSELN